MRFSACLCSMCVYNCKAIRHHADHSMHAMCLPGSSEEEQAASRKHSKEKKPKKKVEACSHPPSPGSCRTMSTPACHGFPAQHRSPMLSPDIRRLLSPGWGRKTARVSVVQAVTDGDALACWRQDKDKSKRKDRDREKGKEKLTDSERLLLKQVNL